MLIPVKAITSAKGATDKKDIRIHLRAVLFDFDTETKRLSIVGTNAQCMIVNTFTVADEDVDFCKKHFMYEAYFINDLNADKKATYLTFNEIDGRLVCNGQILEKMDMRYPNWKAVVPTKDLVKAKAYCGWNSELIKQVDKALGWKETIMTKIPEVNKDEEREHLNPHKWTLYGVVPDTETVVMIMPMRID